MADAGVLSVLTRTTLFADVDEDGLHSLAEQSRARRYEKAQRVFTRGDAGEHMYVVAVGSVALTASGASGGEVVLAVVRPPQWFGELAVIDDGPRVATATAREATVLVSVPRIAVTRVLSAYPAVAGALLTSLTGLIRRVDEHAVDLTLVNLEGRVRKLLAATAQALRVGRPPGAGESVAIDLRMTQTELAQLVGGSRQHVNRIIMALEAEGAVTRRGSRIVAVRPDLLSRG